MNLIDRLFNPPANKAYSARRTSLLILITIAIFLSGCQSQVKQPPQDDQFQKLQQENESLRSQIETLLTLTPQIRLETLSELKKIKIRSRTGFYDKDRDGKKEVLKVYVQPIDTAGDKVKVPGSVSIELLDADADADATVLKKWQVGPEELKNKWVGTFMTHYYRLIFDVSDMPAGQYKELHLKVSFTDYVTGKIFVDDKTVTP